MAEPRHGPALASAAATAAADALARLFDGPGSESLECRQIELAQLTAEALHNGQTAGVFAEFEGVIGGRVAVTFAPEVAHELLVRLVGDGPAAKLDERARSALLEMGNIAFSAAAGALGDGLGGIVFPTVPRLSGELGQEFSVPQGDPGRRVRTIWSARTEPLDRGGRLALTFLWQPGTSSRRTILERSLS